MMIIIFIFLGFFYRQQDSLMQKMDTSGYREKVPTHIQEENVMKLNKLMQELEIIDEADRNLGRAIARTTNWRIDEEMFWLFPNCKLSLTGNALSFVSPWRILLTKKLTFVIAGGILLTRDKTIN